MGGGRGADVVGDVGRVAVLVLLPPSRGDDPGLALVPVCRVVHLASSCLLEGGWRTGASGSDGGGTPQPFSLLPSSSDERSEIGDLVAPKANLVVGSVEWLRFFLTPPIGCDRQISPGGGQMAVVVTVMNMKGGVGKTTVATNFSGLVSQIDLNGKGPYRVLAIDYDPQFNLSQSFLTSKKYFDIESKKKTTLSILFDDENKLDPYQLIVPGNHTPPKVSSIAVPVLGPRAGKGGLDLVPSTLDLMYVALGQANSQVKPIEERFQKFIAEARASYDLIVIDCHPAGSLFTKTSLSNSDHVIIPVMPQRYAVRGIGLMMNFIESKKIGGAGPSPHILFNAAPRDHITPEETEIRGNAKYTKYCLPSTLKKYKAFSEVEGGAGYVWRSAKPYSTLAFNNIVSVSREILSRIGL